MTRQEIDAVLARVRSWPEGRQSELAHVALEMERQEKTIYVLSAEERADIDEGLAEADRGDFASDEEIAAILKKHRR